jgi:hypothetical protein
MDNLVRWAMSKSGKRIVAVALVGAAAVGLYSVGSSMFGEDGETAGAKHAVNQVWIERLPSDARDQINHFVLVRHPQGKIGAVGKSSQWRHHVELFLWGLEGERLSVFLPQEQHKAQLNVRTWECADEAPEPFELCLELKNKRGSVTMYSRKDWIIEPKDVAGSIADIVEGAPELAGVFAADGALAVEPSEQQLEGADRWAEVELLPAM